VVIGHDVDVVRHIKNTRHPVVVEIDGESMTFLTISYCARALGRTTACIKNWERLGLLPPPYRLTGNGFRLYPLGFVTALSQIKDQGYVGRRMDRSDWGRFQAAVWSAFDSAPTGKSWANVVTGSCSDDECTEVTRLEGPS
jgi:hypothetical protein